MRGKTVKILNLRIAAKSACATVREAAHSVSSVLTLLGITD